MIGAVSYLWKGFKLLISPPLRPFVLMPLLINLVLYSMALVLGFLYLNHLVEQMIPQWLHWLTWFIYPLFFISFCFIGFFTFSLLANLIAAPFYAKLAAKTLEVIDAPLTQFFEPSAKQVWQAEFKRLHYSMIHTLPLLILFVIPVVNLIAPLLWLGFSAWCVALEYFAYPQENCGVLFPEQQANLKTNVVSALSFGGLVTLGQALPIINIVIAPVAVIAATLHVQARTNTV
ncbi:MAG: sulfate transporter CysZ [Methylococcales bacterium]|nr:sulfate transporter CysZ [Methylococcales bacterium]